MQLPEQHFRVMLDAADPIHRACDFFVQRSDNSSLVFELVNERLHSQAVWAPWPDFLIAFASNGCGDFFAYDIRCTPPSIIYIGPEDTPEEHLGDPDALRYDTFAEWYESEIAVCTCTECGSRDTRIEASEDKMMLVRICPSCGFQKPTDVIES